MYNLYNLYFGLYKLMYGLYRLKYGLYKLKYGLMCTGKSLQFVSLILPILLEKVLILIILLIHESILSLTSHIFNDE